MKPADAIAKSDGEKNIDAIAYHWVIQSEKSDYCN